MSETEMLQQMAAAMPLAKTALDLSGDGQGYGLIIVDEVNRLDGIVTTVDAVLGSAQLDTHPEPIKQAAVATGQ